MTTNDFIDTVSVLDQHRLRRNRPAQVRTSQSTESSAQPRVAILVLTLPPADSSTLEAAVETLVESVSRLGFEVHSASPRVPQTRPTRVLEVGKLRMELDKRQVYLSGRPVELRKQEYLLLKAFLAHPDQVLSRAQLLKLAWGLDGSEPGRTVDVHVRRLRSKLDGDSSLVTVRGFGYRLSA